MATFWFLRKINVVYCLKLTYLDVYDEIRKPLWYIWSNTGMENTPTKL